MPNPTGSASAVAQITPRRKPQARGQTAASFILTAQHVDGSGMFTARSYPGEVTADPSAGTGELLAVIFSRLLHVIPQSCVVGS